MTFTNGTASSMPCAASTWKSIKAKEVVILIRFFCGNKPILFARSTKKIREEPRAARSSSTGSSLSHDVRNMEHVRTETGMVFQSFNLFPHLTVLQNVTWPPSGGGGRNGKNAQAEEVAMQLLKSTVGITDQANKFPGQLSGGQQQRVAIARALAMTPTASLTYDEDLPRPSIRRSSKEVLDVMIELAKSGMTMAVVTHEIGTSPTPWRTG